MTSDFFREKMNPFLFPPPAFRMFDNNIQFSSQRTQNTNNSLSGLSMSRSGRARPTSPPGGGGGGGRRISSGTSFLLGDWGRMRSWPGRPASPLMSRWSFAGKVVLIQFDDIDMMSLALCQNSAHTWYLSQTPQTVSVYKFSARCNFFQIEREKLPLYCIIIWHPLCNITQCMHCNV